MFYWLFTDGRDFLSGLVTPLLCLTLFMPLIVSALLGAGIQRSGEPRGISGWKRGAKLLTHLIALLGVTAIYVSGLGDTAVQPLRGKTTANAFIRALAGGPDNVYHLRLFLFGIMLVLVGVVVTLGLHSGIKNGGWLRERVDRLRTPQVRRGALGSSHFCTLREYKRFRREDQEGLTLLGAFWGGTGGGSIWAQGVSVWAARTSPAAF